ncbi:unnamed protein product [Gordionus sp. m RMFG-2023]
MIYINLNENLNDSQFFHYLGLSRNVFYYILNKIETKIIHKQTNAKTTISPEKRLFVTLRYLRTGLNYSQLSYSSRISKNVGSYGKQSDGGTFRNSSLYQKLEKGSASIDDIDPTLANLTTRPFLASRENN